VEKLDGDKGDTVELAEVLAVGDGKSITVGDPRVDGARVAATVLEQKKSDKIIVFKKKRRKNYRRTKGHRQQVTVIRINDILAKGEASKPKEASPAENDQPKAKAKAKAKAKKAPAKAKKAPAKAKKAPTGKGK
ncbi:MAG: 50S ribosomal protein L21, partial [Pseudomonadota bacterium]|nr:50S ribosomal protein L21 [Pseudomonadota bacterium]